MANEQKKTTSRSLNNVKPKTKSDPPDNMKKADKVVKKRK